MDTFNYLSVFVSIILGLGVTQLLSSFADWLEHRNTVSAHGPSLAWAGTLLLLHIQTWWTLFGLRHIEHWQFLQFFLLLLQPILLYLLAALALPRASVHPDLQSAFHGNRRWFFALLIALLGVSLLKDLLITGSLPQLSNLLFHAGAGVTAMAGITVRHERFHQLLAYGTVLVILLYIGLLFTRLP